MSKKPGLFSRIRNSISSTLNDAVDAMSDPGQEVALMLDDLADNIKKGEGDLRQAMVDQKVMARKLEGLQKDEANWHGRATQAVKIGDDKLARAALQRKSEVTTERKSLEEAMAQQQKTIDSMRDGLKEAKAKLKSLNMRRGSLMAQARAAKKGRNLEEEISSGGEAGARINAIEDKIAAIEALNEVNSGEMNERVAEAELDAKFANLDATDELDDELAALKAKLDRKALTDGD
ncbi:MAG: PspA/IM30 family protein [Myxococcales bacterium]|nr:PspA/IM30 family protein [Myxococcales bacterium]MCB9752626.1 PspA/IM30 family protein [Myxococcales bacterium]